MQTLNLFLYHNKVFSKTLDQFLGYQNEILVQGIQSIVFKSLNQNISADLPLFVRLSQALIMNYKNDVCNFLILKECPKFDSGCLLN